MDSVIDALNAIHRPHTACSVLPGADSAGDGIVVEWRTWGGLWMWHVMSWSARTGVYQHVWNSPEGFDVRHFDMAGNEVPAPE